MFSKKKCPNCGAKNPEGLRACGICGAPFPVRQIEEQLEGRKEPTPAWPEEVEKEVEEEKAEEEVEIPTSICESCGAENLKESSHCCQCGMELIVEETSIDWKSRRLCSDGTCIGAINEQGVCNICGKPYSGGRE